MAAGGRHRISETTAAGDALPTALAVRTAREAALSGLAAAMHDLPWPPGREAHELLDLAPLMALSLLDAACKGVGLPRLARCLGLDAVSGPARLAAAEASGTWPIRAYVVARLIMESAT